MSRSGRLPDKREYNLGQCGGSRCGLLSRTLPDGATTVKSIFFFDYLCCRWDERADGGSTTNSAGIQSLFTKNLRENLSSGTG